MTLSELLLGETIGDIVDLQTITCRFSVEVECFCMLYKRISSISLFIETEITENPTAKYENFWFCVTLSATLSICMPLKI